MSLRQISLRVALGLTSMALVVAVSRPTELAAANKSGQTFKKPIRNPKFDPSAEQVDLFDAVDAGDVTVKLIPKSAMGGNVLIENKTDKPLTVKIPEAVVGISIHAQGANFGASNLGAGNLGLGNPGGGAGNAQQALGGGIGQLQGNNGPGGIGQGNGQGNAQGVGQNFFSIPADKVVSLPFNSVCLEHGKLEPTANSKYTLVPVSRVSRDPALYQLLTIVGSGKDDPKAAQAAAWHMANKMTFQELAEKINTPLGSLTQTPDFTQEQISRAEHLVARAKQMAADADLAKSSEQDEESKANSSQPVRIVTK